MNLTAFETKTDMRGNRVMRRALLVCIYASLADFTPGVVWGDTAGTPVTIAQAPEAGADALAQTPAATDPAPTGCPPAQPTPPPKQRPQQRPNPCACVQHTVYCAPAANAVPSGDKTPAGSADDDKRLKLIEQVLTSVKENSERAIGSATASNETVKWVYIVQSALATFVGVLLASMGGVLGYFGFRSLRDFQRFQLRARKQRELIRRRFLDESKRMSNWAEINTQFAAASAPLATLASIRDEEVRDETLRVVRNIAPDEFAREQRENRKRQAFDHAMRAIRRLKELAGQSDHARFLSWAAGAEAAAQFHAGNLDTALQQALKAKADNPMNHPDRAYWLGFVYARMYYERKDSALKHAALREFRETFSRDPGGAFLALAQGDKELELYLGKEALAQLAAEAGPAAPAGGVSR